MWYVYICVCLYPMCMYTYSLKNEETLSFATMMNLDEVRLSDTKIFFNVRCSSWNSILILHFKHCSDCILSLVNTTLSPPLFHFMCIIYPPTLLPSCIIYPPQVSISTSVQHNIDPQGTAMSVST